MVFACGDGTSEVELPEESGTPNPIIPAFLDAPSVAFGGQGADSTADPESCVFESRYEIGLDEAHAIGFDVEADHDFLDREIVVDVLASGNEVATTKVHWLGQIARILRADFTPPAGVALDEAYPRGCPPVVINELTVQMFTEDASLQGIFSARTKATPLGSVPSLDLYAGSDLRNFRGSLPVARASGRPFYAKAVVRLYDTVDSTVAFSFDPSAIYLDDDGNCYEPLCPAASASRVEPLSYGVSTVPEMLSFAEHVRSFADPSVSSLTDLVTTMGPYHPDVRLWVRATSVESTSVQVRARVNGKEVQTPPVELTHDPGLLTETTVGGWIGIGEVDESSPVEFEVENPAGLTEVWADILIGGCRVKEASCAGPGCIVRNAVSVSPPDCSWR